jgi:hypothetical protein
MKAESLVRPGEDGRQAPHRRGAERLTLSPTARPLLVRQQRAPNALLRETGILNDLSLVPGLGPNESVLRKGKEADSVQLRYN